MERNKRCYWCGNRIRKSYETTSEKVTTSSLTGRLGISTVFRKTGRWWYSPSDYFHSKTCGFEMAHSLAKAGYLKPRHS